MKITTEELRQAVNLVLAHLEESGQREFEVEEDFYWNIPEAELYNPYNEPSNLDLGQLSDDIKEIRKILTGESPCVGDALVWIAALMRRLGKKSIG